VGDRPIEGGTQLSELGLPSDHRLVEPSIRNIVHRAQPVRDERPCLAFRGERCECLDRDCAADEPSVVSPIRTSPDSAACSNRAATLTASPVASRSSLPVTISPVLMPILASTPRTGSACLISSAARTARSASSSCTLGIPNTAMTASPMNFSTRPPWRSTICLICSK